VGGGGKLAKIAKMNVGKRDGVSCRLIVAIMLIYNCRACIYKKIYPYKN